MTTEITFSSLNLAATPMFYANGSFGRRAPIDELGLDQLFPDLDFMECSFRAVSIDRLPAVLEGGIDVEPTTSRIFVAHFEKAWEYGDFPKVVMAFRDAHLKPSVVRVAANSGEDVLESLRAHYPFATPDGEDVWYSLVEDFNAGYDLPYGRWLANDPLDALRAIFLFSCSKGVDGTLGSILADITSSIAAAVVREDAEKRATAPWSMSEGGF